MAAPKFHYYYDNVVPAELCRRVIETFEVDTEGQFEGKVGGQVYAPNLKRCTDIQISGRLLTDDGRKLWSDIDAELYACVGDSWARYQRDVPSVAYIHTPLGIEDTGYQLQRYAKGEGRFGPHIDAGGLDTACRIAAAIVYFNTVEEGGGTRFPVWEVTVDAVEGRVVWFPATWTHVHEGVVPISGPKYIASTFMCFRGHDSLALNGSCYQHIVDALKLKDLRKAQP